MFAPPLEPIMDNIKYESIGQYAHPQAGQPAPSQFYCHPFTDYAQQPANYYSWAQTPVAASVTAQQPNIHVNYIMNSNVIHNYGSAPSPPSANTGLAQQQQTQSVSTF